ncbi:D-2-hydroxyacid dehydrogenase [Metabacillus halosaccharovorans]|uniref:D-2-hydroxyacid dehydrogenase n=1 Tax=Metabacillus halosaccharovorans TaxID=930124 RepID=UPI001C1FC8F2|nr:D-2-hydroxyacid dehydrogenase [Metabacillus halosaccharovorans]MBU7591103.1 D-2-hydroxyacid dehydrogenase [Metabacillus halosaccharovorans]
MRDINTVLTTVNYSDEHFLTLAEAFAPAKVIRLRANDNEGIQKALKTADVAVLSRDLDERFLQAPLLRWVHCDHAGLNKFAGPEIFERELLVTSSAGRSAPVLAEHAIFFMLNLAFQYPRFLDAQRAHQFGVPGQEDLRGLYGRTVGVIGLGNTGSELAVRLKAMGMNVLGYRRSAGSPPPGVDRLYCGENGDTLDELLSESDFVVLAVPLNNATHHLIGRRELSLMKRSACIINMARGAVIDEEALTEALYAGQIGGAGLDTFTKEPLPADSPLWDAPNTLITPHTTPQVPDRTGRTIDIIKENIRRYRAGEPLLNQLQESDIYTPEQKEANGGEESNGFQIPDLDGVEIGELQITDDVYSIHCTFNELFENKEAEAVLNKYLGESFRERSSYNLVKGITIDKMVDMAPQAMPAKLVFLINKELSKIKK